MATSHESEHSEQGVHHPSTKQYVVIAIILFAITMVEFVLIWDRAGINDYLGLSRIPLLIFLSAIKFAIVILFYMHLKFDNPLFFRVFMAGLVLAFMVGLSLIGLFTAIKGDSRDFAQANATAYAGHEEDGHGAESRHGHIADDTATANLAACWLGRRRHRRRPPLLPPNQGQGLLPSAKTWYCLTDARPATLSTVRCWSAPHGRASSAALNRWKAAGRPPSTKTTSGSRSGNPTPRSC